ncbi:MAG TPA: transketolase [Woeseiaceae bacterium]|nr:transketolase [Woeseiaceae bacterium]
MNLDTCLDDTRNDRSARPGDAELARKSLAYRRGILTAIKHAGAGHTGGSLSSTDILNVLYNRVLRVSPDTIDAPDRDRYVQSKGHSVEALFVVLADKGFYPAAELETLCGYRSHFVGHPTRKVPGIEQNTGALGHGLPICTGMALGGKLDEADFRVYTLLGDGELAEGSNWEAAMAAAHYRLDNLTAIVDCNTLQITGRTRDVMNSEPLAAKFEAFGWAVRTVDGHDFGALTDALATPLETGKPSAVIARTTKGKGVSFMEDNGAWHHKVPNDDEYARALAEIDAALARLSEPAQ